MLPRLLPGGLEHHEHARLPGARTSGEAVHGPRMCPVCLEHRWVWLLEVWVFTVLHRLAAANVSGQNRNGYNKFPISGFVL